MKKRAIVIRHGRKSLEGNYFAEGLRAHGWEVAIENNMRSCDLLILWGTRNFRTIKGARRQRIPIVIMERGYIGDRFAETSISFGGEINGRATFPAVSEDPARFLSKFEPLLKTRPHKPDGPIILIGQKPGDMTHAHADINCWYRKQIQIASRTRRDLWFRLHPGALHMTPPCKQVQRGDLQQALKIASCICTFSSNTAVEAMLEGVPTVAADNCSMAWGVAAKDLGEEKYLPYETRLAWAAKLAWKQWTHEELTSGYCWEHVGKQLG